MDQLEMKWEQQVLAEYAAKQYYVKHQCGKVTQDGWRCKVMLKYLTQV